MSIGQVSVNRVDFAELRKQRELLATLYSRSAGTLTVEECERVEGLQNFLDCCQDCEDTLKRDASNR